jgi:two-component system, NtrC family, sensor kinase
MNDQQSTSSSTINTVSKRLEERIKELSCLYELSKITQQTNLTLSEQLEAICKHIPQGFLFPEKLIVQLIIDNKTMCSPQHKLDLKKDVPILVEGRKRGELTIGYPKNTKKNTPFSFLKEEEQLLEKITLEIAQLIARKEQIEREKVYQEKLHKEDRFNVLVELTAGIAHELNTPLANILGYAELIKNEVPDTIIKNDAEKIIRSTLNAREIVKKLMYFSCEMPSNFNLIQLNDIIKEAVDLLKIQLEEAQFKIQFNLDEKLPLIKGDQLQLTQVFLNLLLNAIGAKSNAPTLNLSTTLYNNQITIRITDNGTGIPEEQVGKIFQPFYTTKKTGTGLGLAVVHGIIQSHSGIIFVDVSKKGETSFVLTFPIQN